LGLWKKRFALGISLGFGLLLAGRPVQAAALCMSDAELKAYSWEALSVGLDQFFWSCEGAYGDRLESHYAQLRIIRAARKRFEAERAESDGGPRRRLAVRPFERRFPGRGPAAFQETVKRDARGYTANAEPSVAACKLQLENWAKAIERFGFERSLERFATMSVATSEALGRRPLPKCR